MEENTELTFGQKAVGLTFNPSKFPQVDLYKKQCAELIDNLNDARNRTEDEEVKRMYSEAITHIQVGQMWAVKAVTWNV